DAKADGGRAAQWTSRRREQRSEAKRESRRESGRERQRRSTSPGPRSSTSPVRRLYAIRRPERDENHVRGFAADDARGARDLDAQWAAVGFCADDTDLGVQSDAELRQQREQLRVLVDDAPDDSGLAPTQGGETGQVEVGLAAAVLHDGMAVRTGRGAAEEVGQPLGDAR